MFTREFSSGAKRALSHTNQSSLRPARHTHRGGLSDNAQGGGHSTAAGAEETTRLGKDDHRTRRRTSFTSALTVRYPGKQRIKNRSLCKSERAVEILSLFNAHPRNVGVTPLIRNLTNAGNVRDVIYAANRRQRVLSRMLRLFSVGIRRSLSIVLPKRALGNLFTHLVAQISALLRRIGPSYILIRNSASATATYDLTTFRQHVPVKRIRTNLHANSLARPFPRRVGHHIISIVNG